MFFINFLNSILIFALHFENQGNFPPPLKRSEEALALQEMAQGSKKAKDKLINHNLRLVAHIAKKYNTSESDNEELISVGTIGLIKAIDSFKPDKEVRLATYASRCIENEILMYFRNKKKNSLDVSLNEPLETDSEGNQLTLIDIIYTEDTIAEDYILEADKIKLYEIINNKLNDKERELITWRYGLFGQKERTQNEIAHIYGISRSYVSRLETKILKKMRKEFDN